METNRDDQMKIDIIDGKFVISVGVDLVCHAVTYGADILGDEMEIIDNDVFTKEILKELKSEGEDGTNLIHLAFDRAAINAIENGAEGVGP